VRICDIGGWTDTWFGGPGRVVNIAVTPGVEVSIRSGAQTAPPVVLDVAAYGDRYPVVPGTPRAVRHPLLEAAIDAFPPPPDHAVEISIRSVVPAGCGAGTSASVAVALVGALAASRSEPLSVRDAAYAAHRLEVEVLGAESGIQDQLSAAFGGINHLEIEPYPDATVHPLPAWDALGPRLSLVFLGRPHDSSDVHRQVITGMGKGRDATFSRLRDAATAARDRGARRGAADDPRGVAAVSARGESRPPQPAFATTRWSLVCVASCFFLGAAEVSPAEGGARPAAPR
jgi:D-glycero-alpha-D-manno-heptose-7-phosphate kinase